jgi:mono/diheme cytochrome c family protein
MLFARTRFVLLAGLLFAAPLAAAAGASPTDQLAKRGEYVYRAAGCYGCHTDEKHAGKPLAGRHALATPFGTFYTPNITPDPETGIGRWSEQDFLRALREGLSPAGDHYYPSFPYPSYTRLTDEDLRALWAYLKLQPPVKQANRKHDLKWFARARSFVGSWKVLYFAPGAYRPDATKSAVWNRGAYLAEAAAHCGECHTPRTALGGIKSGMHYAGTRDGPEDSVVPNITPDRKTGIGRWRASELAEYLETGMTPDGDSAGDLMAEVIDNGLQYLRKEDLAAIAAYVLSLPPVEHSVRKAGKKPVKKEEFE